MVFKAWPITQTLVSSELTTNNITEMEEQLNRLNKNSKNIGLKMHKGKTKCMTNFQHDQEIHIESEKIEEVTNYKYLGQMTYLKDTTKEEVTRRIRAGWSCFGTNREIFQGDQMQLSLKRQVFDQCVRPTMTYGCQMWSLTKATTQRLRTAQRKMERKMLKAKWKDKILCREIRTKKILKT